MESSSRLSLDSLLTRDVIRVMVVGELLAFLGCLLSLSSHVGVYAPGFLEGALAAIGASNLWCAADAARRVPTGAPLKLAAVVNLAVFLAHPFVWTSGSPADYPPLFHAAILALGLVPVTFGAWPARVSTALIGLVFVATRNAQEPLPQAVLDCSVLVTSGWMCVEVLALLLAAEGEVRLRSHETALARVDRDRVTAQADQAGYWDAATHDLVLGSLGAAARGGGDSIDSAAQTLARRALEVFREGRGQTTNEEAADHVRATADRLGLSLDCAVSGRATSRAAASALAAVDEALTNVAHHAGTSRVTVRGVVGADWIHLVVQDEGCGFSGNPSARRQGIRLGIMRRMEAVGGHAQVLSRPGAGTRVELSWNAPAASAIHDWRPRSFLPLALPLVLNATLHVIMGATQLQSVRYPPASYLAMALLLGATVASFLVPANRRWLAGLLAVIGFATLLAALNRINDYPDWTLWFAGGSTSVLGVLAFRFSTRSAIAAVVASFLVTSIANVWVTGTDILSAAAVANTYTAPLLSVIVVVWMKRSLDVASQRIGQQVSALADEQIAAHRAAASLAEWQQRSESLARNVFPLLTLLADAASITPRLRQRCMITEAACRDDLAAPGLVTKATAELLARVRAQGANVEIHAEGPTESSLADGIERLLHGLLRDRKLERILINAHPTTTPLAEVTLFGTSPPATDADITRAAGVSGLVVTSEDIGQLQLVEIHACEP